MVRPLRIEYPGAWYHVTSRGNEKRRIFKDDQDRKKFLEILFTSKTLYDVEVHAYVLMENHFHLIIMTTEANLSGFMQRFNTTYTVYYNRRHKRSGHLYQGRYKAILIEEDSYLLELSRYVHLNPVRIKKFSRFDVKEKKKIIQRYPWSSYMGYVRLMDRQDFVNYDKILGMVSGGDEKERRKNYKKFVMNGIMKDMNLTFWNDVKGQVVLGTEGFVEWVYGHFFSENKEDPREIPGIKGLKTRFRTVEEIARAVSSEFGVKEEELYQRHSSYRDARSVLMELCRIYLSRSMPMAEIGRRLGDISASAFSRNRVRLGAKMDRDIHLRQCFDKLKKTGET